MDEINAVAGLIEKGFAALFIWMYFAKDKELKQSWSDRLADAKNWIDTLTSVILQTDKPTPPPLMKARKLITPELDEI